MPVRVCVCLQSSASRPEQEYLSINLVLWYKNKKRKKILKVEQEIIKLILTKIPGNENSCRSLIPKEREPAEYKYQR